MSEMMNTSITLGQIHTIYKKIGGSDGWEAAQRDDVTIKLLDAKQELFDRTGRRVPLLDSKIEIFRADDCDKFVQPDIDYAYRLNRLARFFPTGTQFISVEEFEIQSNSLLNRLKQDIRLSNLLNGTYLPICLPKIEKSGNYGEVLSVFIEALKKSYLEQFPKRKFYNLVKKDELLTMCSIVENNHRGLINKIARVPIVGILFFPFQGFPVSAQIEQMVALPNFLYFCDPECLLPPKSFALSGAIDIATAIIAYPDILVNGEKGTLDLSCSATSLGWDATFEFSSSRSELGILRNTNICLNISSSVNTGGLLFFQSEH
jgi:hypothetical protein